jgi:hypothetical protein
MVRRQLSSHSHHSGNSTCSSRSDASDVSHSTAPSVYSQKSLLKYSQDRSVIHHDRVGQVGESPCYQDLGYPRSSFSSVDIYASTLPSEEDLTHQQPFEVAATHHDVYASDATPSNPAEFAALFPSNRRLLIHHDDATSDGNMNLRVDTYLPSADGRRRKLTLFHLRMHDLKDRRFSLRRYCRESGREICSSNRKHAFTSSLMSTRSNIQQSLGTAFQQLRLSHEESSPSRNSGSRRDLGYESTKDQYHSRPGRGSHASKAPHSATNTIQLEFSNYAHVDVDSRGSKRSKRHEYEFWGTRYTWKRQVYRDGGFEEVSYHLISDKTSKSIAHITPEPLTAREALEEEELGSWVPPCTMRIIDESVFRGLTDVAELVHARCSPRPC